MEKTSLTRCWLNASMILTISQLFRGTRSITHWFYIFHIFDLFPLPHIMCTILWQQPQGKNSLSNKNYTLAFLYKPPIVSTTCFQDIHCNYSTRRDNLEVDFCNVLQEDWLTVIVCKGKFIIYTPFSSGVNVAWICMIGIEKFCVLTVRKIWRGDFLNLWNTELSHCHSASNHRGNKLTTAIVSAPIMQSPIHQIGHAEANGS